MRTCRSSDHDQGVVRAGTELTASELIAIDTATAALIGATLRIVLTSVFLMSERFRRIWSSIWIRLVVIGAHIFDRMALLETGWVESAPVLVGAITMVAGGLLARVALCNRIQSAT